MCRVDRVNVYCVLLIYTITVLKTTHLGVLVYKGQRGLVGQSKGNQQVDNK